VVEAFRDAISGPGGFLTEPTLRYNWIKYLPSEPILDDFWGTIRTDLLEELLTDDFFYSRDGTRCIPGKLRIQETLSRDIKGEPLLADLSTGSSYYISESYNESDLFILEKLGAQPLGFRGFIDRLKQDLTTQTDQKSRMKSTLSNDEWHDRMAEYLILIAKYSESWKREIALLGIVPLDNGRWVPVHHPKLFFPSFEGVDIPGNLGLNLVKAEALKSPRRRALLVKLGVPTCPPQMVFQLIWQRYESKQMEHSWATCLQDVKFLFWHHSHLTEGHKPIYLIATDNTLYRAGSGAWFYSPMSDSPYASFKLFSGSVPKLLQNDMRFVNERYYNMLGNCGIRNDTTGIEWLHQYVGIKDTPQLFSRTKSGALGAHMSAELEYIAQHLPEKLLGVLRDNWKQYNEAWDGFFKKTEVPVLNMSKKVCLDECYLPLPGLKSVVSRLRLDSAIGFLQEMDGQIDRDPSGWSFLEKFGVRMTEDISFWLSLLKHARNQIQPDYPAVFEIYERVQSFILGAEKIR
jgi:hypothetical protein